MTHEAFLRSITAGRPYLSKTAVDNSEEPSQLLHSHSPAQLLRPRSEVIVYSKDGILGIKKKTYLLLPGGGIADGETPEGSVIREAMEEASAILKNVEAVDVVSTTYDKDNIISEGWDGEKTHFFFALYGGDAKTSHPDNEKFRFIPFIECIGFLKDLLKDPTQQWASANNKTRLRYIMKAKEMATKPLSFILRKYAEDAVDRTGYDKNVWRSESRNSAELAGGLGGAILGGTAGTVIAGAPHAQLLKKVSPAGYSYARDALMKRPQLYAGVKKALPIARFAVPAVMAASFAASGRRHGREIGDTSWALNRVQTGVGNKVLNIPQKNKAPNNSYVSSAIGAATMGAATGAAGTLIKSKLFKTPVSLKTYGRNAALGVGAAAAMGLANNAFVRSNRAIGRSLASGDTYATRNE